MIATKDKNSTWQIYDNSNQRQKQHMSDIGQQQSETETCVIPRMLAARDGNAEPK